MWKSIRTAVNLALYSVPAQDVWRAVVWEQMAHDSEPPVNYDQWAWVKKEIVWSLVDEAYVQQRIANDPERIDKQHHSLIENGWTAPILVIWDENGKAMVKDGNHRLIAAYGMEEMTHVPIVLEQVPSIRKGGTRIGELLAGILEDYGEQVKYKVETQDYILRDVV